VVVTGYRASLQSALTLKKNSDVMMDAINAEDIADFPDSNLAESLQRLPGISIDRDNGEGRTISVRGLSGDFSRVRINNMEALSTGAANDAGSSPTARAPSTSTPSPRSCSARSGCASRRRPRPMKARWARPST
jgi:iron complex outermembrane receptor protein